MKERQIKTKAPHKTLSKRSRALMLGVNLSSLYYVEKGASEDDVTLMNEIREIYGIRPFQGYRRVTLDLKDGGYNVNPKKVYRLMKEAGIQAVYPKKNLSKRNQAHKVYPYLLKDHPPAKPHDVWCADITYIKIAKGFVYLVGLIDVVSRCVVGFNVSSCLDTTSCLDALAMAMNKGYRPKIINSDQGCQFTSQEWAYSLSLLQIKISMDGKGRCLDNIPIERFWRTIKYEEVYLKTYETVGEAKESIAAYIEWYNHKRRHSGLNNNRPYEVMMGSKTAPFWSLSGKKKRVDGYVDNPRALPTKSTTPTTTTKQNYEKNKMNYSSEMDA